MDQNSSLISVIKLLKDGGESPEDITRVIQELTNAASAKVYLEMRSVLTEDDLTQLDKIQSQEEADTLLRSIYAQRTKSAPELIVNDFLDTFAESFIDKYNLDKIMALAKPVEVAPPTL